VKRAGKVKWGELHVGILVLLALIFALYASFRGAGTSIFKPKTNYVCYFKDLNGLVVGAPVWLAGVEVGSVSGIDFLDSPRAGGKPLKVSFQIRSSLDYIITQGTYVEISTIGLLGDKYLRLNPGPHTAERIQAGSVIESRGISGLDGALANAPELTSRIDNILTSLENLIVSVDTGSGTLNRLIKDPELADQLNLLLTKSEKLMTTLERSASTLTNDISTIRADFHSVSEQLLEGEGTIAALLKDPAPFEHLVSSTARLDTLMQRVAMGDGTAGQLINDQALYEELADLIARANALVKDISDNPKRYLKFSIF
jgi:phospholipid/cholesterol/gamma-HCH transport system substrate-binding protein